MPEFTFFPIPPTRSRNIKKNLSIIFEARMLYSYHLCLEFSSIYALPSNTYEVVHNLSVIFQDKIEKATAAIEAAKKSEEEFNKAHFLVVFLFLCFCFQINAFIRVFHLFCEYLSCLPVEPIYF